jgi:predicted nucleotidyltransferase
MIDEKDRDIILTIARKYHVSKVFLFGSSLVKDAEARDIDLSKKSKFTEMVRREGILLDA